MCRSLNTTLCASLALAGPSEANQETSEKLVVCVKYKVNFVLIPFLCVYTARSGDFTFRFRVKLYPVSTTYIFDEVTRQVLPFLPSYLFCQLSLSLSPSFFNRYFLSLQLKEDLVNMKLMCSDETYCVLAGYVVQGEFGDYDPMDHTPGYLDDFPFLENVSPELRAAAEENHRKNRSLNPAECDRRFLDLACRLDRYGMDFHPVMVSQIKKCVMR